MDDLEFRRKVYADPNCADEEILKALADDPKKREFLRELKLLDKKMHQASQVEVPIDLASKLILRQTMHSHNMSKKRNRIQLALAASIAFVMGVSFMLWQQNNLINISEHAIAHVRAEGSYALDAHENISLQQVNAKLASFGGEISGEIGQIYYANFCDFDNIRSLHLVVQYGDEKLTLFVVPNKLEFDKESESHTKGFHSQTVGYQRANLVVVGEEGADVSQAKRDLSKKFKFST
ncbi:DUF3379 domain-containing protein [Paraglaciecola aquimarina]|uniref:DUF3379 domain-containing protein n=1 Tax=Paraglaciecola aquimarina TaxID=1235557 RepID=A0ABU3SZT5_9ALTE|nr:DUF3379 domain-containing protein [Paraglaciecola aquimarina]MDU0355522.1 DUF3379 domain-containing protein [Paraglaciecola aquimarina]